MKRRIASSKPRIAALLAGIAVKGGRLEVVEVHPDMYSVALYMPGHQVASWSVPIKGDDEQLRGVLQSVLRSISGA